MTMTLVSTITAGAGGVASFEWTNIPQTGTDLMILASTRDSDTGGGGLDIAFNGVTTNLSMRFLRGDGSAIASSTSATRIYSRHDSNDRTANTFGNVQFYIPNYASSTVQKSVSADGVEENNGSNAYGSILAGLWASTSAITSVKIYSTFPNLREYSSASLYIITKGSGGATVS